MTTNEIFVAEVGRNRRYMSFTITYTSDCHKSSVYYTLKAYSLDSYTGSVDLKFEDLESAITALNSFAEDSCTRYEKFLGYLI